VIEFDPDVLWLATPECTAHFQAAFLTTMAERLVAAEARSPSSSPART